MSISQSSKLFLERAGLRPTYRAPTAEFVPGDSAIHDITLADPMPRADFVSDGDPPPDRAGAIEPWPNG
jgi:hypothetical protein